MTSNSIELFTGAKMPQLGFGTWQIADEIEAKAAVLEAIKVGYRHVDTAYLYENEAAIGDALQTAFKSGSVKREDMFITTKLPDFGHNPAKLKSIFMESLGKLQLSYVDLYLIHSPTGCIVGEDGNPARDEQGNRLADTTDHVDIWKAMEKLVDEGLTRAIGLSNFNSEQIKRIYDAARIKPAVLQVECNIFFQQENLFRFCKNLGIAFTAYAPLGAPALNIFIKAKTGKDIPPFPNLMKNPVVEAIAKKYKKTPAQISIRFLLQRGMITIPKSTNPQRIKENFQVFDFQITDDDMNDLKKQDTNKRVFQAMTRLADHPNNPFKIPF